MKDRYEDGLTVLVISISVVLGVFLGMSLDSGADAEYFYDYNYSIVERDASNLVMFNENLYSCKVVLHSEVLYSYEGGERECVRFYESVKD